MSSGLNNSLCFTCDLKHPQNRFFYESFILQLAYTVQLTLKRSDYCYKTVLGQRWVDVEDAFYLFVFLKTSPITSYLFVPILLIYPQNCGRLPSSTIYRQFNPRERTQKEIFIIISIILIECLTRYRYIIFIIIFLNNEINVLVENPY